MVIARCVAAIAAVIKWPMTVNVKLDTNRAWQNAHAAILGNREALLAIAGVFFFLPSLAFALLYPQPPAVQGAMTPEQAMVFIEKFYRESFPFMLAVTVAQIVGAMAILRLYAGTGRPTVGNAIGKGAVDTLAFFAAMILVWLAGSLAASLVVGLGVASGAQAVAGVAAAVAFAGLLYVSLRVILVMPIIAVEGLRKPVAALQRSWALTRGNVGRIVLFLLLLLLAYAVIVGVVASLLGIVFALILGATGGKIAVAIVSSALGAVFTLYLFTSLAAIHRQLAGPSRGELRSTFD